MSNRLLEIAYRYNRLIEEVNNITSTLTIPSLNYFKDYKLNSAIFSDSIFTWSESFSQKFDNIWKYDHYFLNMVSLLFSVGIKYDLPFRIGIAYGDCIIQPEDNLYLGIPLINAYQIEGAQEWIGIGCHPSCLKTPIETNLCFTTSDGIQQGPLIHYNIPIKRISKFPLNFTLDWPRWVNNKEEVVEYIKFKIIETNNLNFKLKWRSTLEFFEQRSNILKDVNGSFEVGYYHSPYDEKFSE